MSDELEVFAGRAAASARAIADSLPEARLRPEVVRLRDVARAFAPRRSGALLRSIEDVKLSILSTSPYVLLQDQGGTVRATRRSFLMVPIRTTFAPGPGHFTVWGRGRGWVRRVGSNELVALRLQSVRIPGSRFLGRALAAHLDKADERVAASLLADTYGVR